MGEMTSTNFNVGMNEARNSSRVLKPPGGGHSDIFGIYEPSQEQQTPRTRHKAPRSTIGAVFASESEVGAATPINHNASNDHKTDLEIEEQPDTSQHIAINDTDDAAPKPSVPVPVQHQQRTRIPPGGFSSGLW